MSENDTKIKRFVVIVVLVSLLVASIITFTYNDLFTRWEYVYITIAVTMSVQGILAGFVAVMI